MGELESALAKMEKEVVAAVKDSEAEVVSGLKRARERGGRGIDRAQKDALAESLTALRRALGATMGAFQKVGPPGADYVTPPFEFILAMTF